MPVRIELCGAVGGKLSLAVSAKVSRNDIDADNADWPGISGTVTPGVAITTTGRVGIDYWIGSAGLKITLDPTIGIYFPVTASLAWNLKYNAPVKGLDWALKPAVRINMDIRVLGGEIGFYNRLRFDKDNESYAKLYGWDPITLYSKELLNLTHTFQDTIKF